MSDDSAKAVGPTLPDGRVAVLVSSDAAELVAAEAAAIRDYIRAHPSVPAASIGAHLLRTRPARRHRAVVMATDSTQLADALDALADGRPHPDIVAGNGPAGPRRVAYTYPGQGSQRPGMGRRYHELSEHYRRAVDMCHDESLRLFGTSPRDYVLGAIDPEEPSATDVRVVQPALFMQMVGITAMWDAAGVVPALTVGHSQGEIAAAYRSGAMTLSDALTIVTIRARLVHELAPRGHTMAVVGIDTDECEDMLARHSGWAQLSVVNSAHILCISGKRDVVVDMVDSLTAQGKFAKEIRVEYPAHTSIVSEYQPGFLDALGTYLENDTMQAGTMPCIGATLGAAIDESMALGDYWFWNLRNRVRFDKAISAAVADHGADFFIEMSEHPTLLLALGETLSMVDDGGIAARPVIGTSRRDADGLEEFTRNVAALAVADTGFRWEAMLPEASSTGAAMAPLEGFPNTVMRRVHLWADRESGVGDEVNTPDWASHQAGRSVHRLTTSWRPLKRRTLLPPRRIAVLDPTGQCGDLAREICAAAADNAAVAVVVDPDSGPGEGVDLADIDTAILLTGPQGTKTDAVQDHVAHVLADGRWRSGLDRMPEQFWWVTVGGENVVASDPVPDVVHGAMTSALRCAAAEYPGVRLRHLDLAADTDESCGAAVVSAIHVAREPELALRDGTLYVKRLLPADAVGDASQPNVDHVLITGGTGKLGLEFCEHLAATGAGRISLVSRSGGSADTARRLDALRRRTGTAVDVLTCDLGDEAAVADLAESLAVPVSFVIHTAMTYVDTSIDAISPALIADAMHAKVVGLQNLLGVIRRSDDLSVVLCSSIAATLGGRAQPLYAMTNRMLDIAATQLRADGTAAVAIEWGLWRVQGPLDEDGVARVEGAGMVPMAPSAAIAAGLADLSGDSIVAAADWSEVRDVLALFGADLVLSEVPDTPVSRPVSTANRPVAESVCVEPDGAHADLAEQTSTAAPAVGALPDALRAELAVAMGLSGGDDLDPDLPLVALGLDSLQALDFRKRVKSSLDRDLPIEAILGGASLRDVVALMR